MSAAYSRASALSLPRPWRGETGTATSGLRDHTELDCAATPATTPTATKTGQSRGIVRILDDYVRTPPVVARAKQARRTGFAWSEFARYSDVNSFHPRGPDAVPAEALDVAVAALQAAC